MVPLSVGSEPSGDGGAAARRTASLLQGGLGMRQQRLQKADVKVTESLVEPRLLVRPLHRRAKRRIMIGISNEGERGGEVRGEEGKRVERNSR